MITVDEIAKRANVSKTAVSFALNNKPGVSKDTRNKILKIARSEGYFEKAVASNSNNKNILLLMCSRSSITTLDRSTAPFYSELISAVERNADEFGYHLLLKSLKIEDDKEIAPEFSSLLSDVAGVLVIATDILLQDVKVLMSLSPNIVLLDALFNTINVNCVVIDNYMGGYKAAQHLIDLGHTNIGYIESYHRIYNFNSRKSGFYAALKDNDLKISDEHLYCTTPIIKKAKIELIESLNKKILPTAFFAENDYIAIGLLEGLTEMKIDVPNEVSVIGFDDIELSAFVSPKLTTIRVFKDHMAHIAVKRLIEQIGRTSPFSEKQIVSIDIIKRNSCKHINNKF